MGCTKIGHQHSWPTTGQLVIQRCEDHCNFCEGAARQKKWKFAWFLRRHVRSVHIKKGPYKDLEVLETWDDEIEKGKAKANKKGNRSRRSVKKEEADDSDADDGLKNQLPLPDGFAPDELYAQYTVNPARLDNMGDFVRDPEHGGGVLMGNQYVDRSQFPGMIKSDDMGAFIDHLGTIAANEYQQILHGSEAYRFEDIPFESTENDDGVALTTDNLQKAAARFGVNFTPPPAALPNDLDTLPATTEDHEAVFQNQQDIDEAALDLPLPTMPVMPDETDLEQATTFGLNEHREDESFVLPSDSSFFEDEWFGINPDDRFFLSDGGSSPLSFDEDLPIASYNTMQPPSPTKASADALGVLAVAHEEMQSQGQGTDEMMSALEMFHRAIGESPSTPFETPVTFFDQPDGGPVVLE